MYVLDRFDVLMSKMIFKKWKNIIGMHFGTKSYLKSTRNHTVKHALRQSAALLLLSASLFSLIFLYVNIPKLLGIVSSCCSMLLCSPIKFTLFFPFDFNIFNSSIKGTHSVQEVSTTAFLQIQSGTQLRDFGPEESNVYWRDETKFCFQISLFTFTFAFNLFFLFISHVTLDCYVKLVKKKFVRTTIEHGLVNWIFSWIFKYYPSWFSWLKS